MHQWMMEKLPTTFLNFYRSWFFTKAASWKKNFDKVDKKIRIFSIRFNYCDQNKWNVLSFIISILCPFGKFMMYLLFRQIKNSLYFNYVFDLFFLRNSFFNFFVLEFFVICLTVLCFHLNQNGEDSGRRIDWLIVCRNHTKNWNRAVHSNEINSFFLVSYRWYYTFQQKEEETKLPLFNMTMIYQQIKIHIYIYRMDVHTLNMQYTTIWCFQTCYLSLILRLKILFFALLTMATVLLQMCAVMIIKFHIHKLTLILILPSHTHTPKIICSFFGIFLLHLVGRRCLVLLKFFWFHSLTVLDAFNLLLLPLFLSLSFTPNLPFQIYYMCVYVSASLSHMQHNTPTHCVHIYTYFYVLLFYLLYFFGFNVELLFDIEYFRQRTKKRVREKKRTQKKLSQHNNCSFFNLHIHTQCALKADLVVQI